MEELIQRLKEQIIEALNLEDITPDDIDNEAPLLEKYYGIKLASPGDSKGIFKNINTIADFVAKNRTK